MQRKNGKTWGYNSSKYSYDKQELAEEISFSWMDDVTQAFEGYSIYINSNFVERGKIDEISVGDFTSDIDYMLLNPSAINEEGFALMAVVSESVNVDTGEYEVKTPVSTIDNNIIGTDGVLATNSLYEVKVYEASDNELKRFSSLVSTTTNYALWGIYTDITCDTLVSVGNLHTGGLVIYDELIDISGEDVNYIAISSLKTNEANLFDIIGWTLPYIEREVDGADLKMQNGLMSWIYLHPNYWVYDLPSTNVTINDSDSVYVQGILRGKKQEVQYPSLEDPDEMKLVKTYLGNGEIESLTVNLSSRMNTITLKYDTE